MDKPRNAKAGRTLNDRGFTLIGITIALTIMLVLANIAMPSVGSTVRSVRLQATTAGLAGDLARARIEAIKRNRVVDFTVTSETQYEIEFVGVMTLDNGAYFVDAPTLVQFAAFGPLLTGPDEFVIGLGRDTRTVSLTVSGFPVLD